MEVLVNVSNVYCAHIVSFKIDSTANNIDLQYSCHLHDLNESTFFPSIFMIRKRKIMQLNNEYKMDNLAYKFYPNLLKLNFLLLEYWQEDNDFLSVFIIISLDHFLQYLKLTIEAVQFSCHWSVKSHSILSVLWPVDEQKKQKVCGNIKNLVLHMVLPTQ